MSLLHPVASLFPKVRRPLIYPLPSLSACFRLSLPSLLSLYPQPGQCASEDGSVKYDLLFLDVPTFPPSLLSSPLLSSPLLSSPLPPTLPYFTLQYSTLSFPFPPLSFFSLLPPSFPSSLLPPFLSVYFEVQRILRKILYRES